MDTLRAGVRIVRGLHLRTALRSRGRGFERRRPAARRWRWLSSCLPPLLLAAALIIPAAARGGQQDGEGQSPSEQPAHAWFDTVVVDAGHGGDDHGGQGPGGLLEKDVVFDVALRLKQRLEAAGLRVVMTRAGDRFVALGERTEIANRAAADLFLSIHANASRHRSARGVETFFASPEATDEAARALAQVENQALGATLPAPVGDPLRAILGDLLATEYLADSQAFARLVQRRVTRAVAARSRGVKQAPFAVLMGVQMPAVLVEIGFLSNAADARALSSERKLESLAEQIQEAVVDFRARQNGRREARSPLHSATTEGGQ